jgi:hypothetical protein
MKNKILKLCKRLNKVTIEEITPILQATRGEICPVLDELVIEGRLELRTDDTYFYKEVEKKKANLPLFFEFHSKEEVDLIIKCFCAEVTAEKASLLLEHGSKTLNKFYTYFRKIIYDIQFKELNEQFKIKLQTPWTRPFFNTNYYFYCYNDKFYFSTEDRKPLKRILHPLKQSKEFKILYSYLYRKMNHNTYEFNAVFHLAEKIWRHKKPCAELIEDLRKLCS